MSVFLARERESERASVLRWRLWCEKANLLDPVEGEPKNEREGEGEGEIGRGLVLSLVEGVEEWTEI